MARKVLARLDWPDGLGRLDSQCTAIRAASRTRASLGFDAIPQFSFIVTGPVGIGPVRLNSDKRIAMQASDAAITDLPESGIPELPGIQYAAPNCSAREQDSTSMIRSEEIEQTKAN